MGNGLFSICIYIVGTILEDLGHEWLLPANLRQSHALQKLSKNLYTALREMVLGLSPFLQIDPSLTSM